MVIAYNRLKTHFYPKIKISRAVTLIVIGIFSKREIELYMGIIKSEGPWHNMLPTIQTILVTELEEIAGSKRVFISILRQNPISH